MPALDFYLEAREAVSNSLYRSEMEWQANLQFKNLSETDFLREAAWVVVNSGFREAIARRCFNFVSLAFGDWESARHIVKNRELCIECALASFKNSRKIQAIADIAERVENDGFASLAQSIVNDPISTLIELPFIGPITVWHLAKNIGCDVAKPDRHMVRVAGAFGFSCVHEFCAEISKATGEKISVVDIVIWRYCTSLSSSRIH